MHVCEAVCWVCCARCLQPAVRQSWERSCSILGWKLCLWPFLPSETAHNFCQSCCTRSSRALAGFMFRESWAFCSKRNLCGDRKPLPLYNICVLSVSAVGGVTSPWKGKYREPRRLALHKESNPQTSLPPAVSPASAAPDPDPAARGCCASPAPPPALERTQQREGTRCNPSRELPRIWDPPPLSSPPLPLKSCSHTERTTTISEQELQQLEIGTEQWRQLGLSVLAQFSWQQQQLPHPRGVVWGFPIRCCQCGTEDALGVNCSVWDRGREE